jgi:hypothetical protein
MPQHDDCIPSDAVSIPDTLPILSSGSHPPGSVTPCVMEAASWLAGEEWSDHPHSVHPVIAAVARGINDHVTDDERQTLWPLILASLDTGRSRSHVVNWRLQRFARRVVRSAGDQPTRETWQSVLERFARLTGHNPMRISAAKGRLLESRLRAPMVKS